MGFNECGVVKSIAGNLKNILAIQYNDNYINIDEPNHLQPMDTNRIPGPKVTQTP